MNVHFISVITHKLKNMLVLSDQYLTTFLIWKKVEMLIANLCRDVTFVNLFAKTSTQWETNSVLSQKKFIVNIKLLVSVKCASYLESSPNVWTPS